MESHEHTQREFGAAIGELVRGADKPYAQSTVRDWIEKSAPEPEIVFQMEGYLLVPPGTLSQHLGYLPVGVRSVTTFQQALMNDTSMGTDGRDILLILYALFASQPLVDATLTEWTRRDLERLVKDAKRTRRLMDERGEVHAERERRRRVEAELAQEQFAVAASGGLPEEEGPAQRRPAPEPEPEGP